MRSELQDRGNDVHRDPIAGRKRPITEAGFGMTADELARIFAHDCGCYREEQHMYEASNVVTVLAAEGFKIVPSEEER